MSFGSFTTDEGTSRSLKGQRQKLCFAVYSAVTVLVPVLHNIIQYSINCCIMLLPVTAKCCIVLYHILISYIIIPILYEVEVGGVLLSSRLPAYHTAPTVLNSSTVSCMYSIINGVIT